DATADAPSAPQTISTLRFKRDRSAATSSALRTETISGAYRSTCCASRSRLPPAARPATRNASGNASTTSSVERPTEPVEPSMDMLRIRKVRSQKAEGRNEMNLLLLSAFSLRPFSHADMILKLLKSCRIRNQYT